MTKDPFEFVTPSLDVSAGRFRGPIIYSPRDEYAPTPLDPEMAEQNQVSAIRIIGMGLHRRAEEAARLHGLPSKLSDVMEEELAYAAERRSSKNMASFDRLLRQVEGKTLDDAMVQIIEKARQSAADPQELLRLIKEYPDMISLEFFKGHSMLDIEKYKEITDRLAEAVELLRGSFQDAEVVLYDNKERHTAFGGQDGIGIYIAREKVAEARSADSKVEILTKSTFLVLPPDFDHSRPALITTIQGEERRMLPLATMAYFRTVNYRERLEEISGKAEELGVRAVSNDPILNMIPPDMREEYLRAFDNMPTENDDA